MLRITVWEMIFRGIPEGAVFIFLGYVLSNKKVNILRLILSAIIFSLSTYTVRLLPIKFGIHSLIIGLLTVFILNIINKINLLKSFITAFLSIVVLYICEWINIIILKKIIGQAFYTLRERPMENILYNYPALVLFFIIVLIIKYFFNKSKKDNLNL